MTNREASEWLKFERNRLIDDDATAQLVEAIDRAIEALEQTEWIPVTERLPEEHTRVLVCDRTSVYMANLNDGWWYFSPAEIGIIVAQSHITAWMPLPKPWKGDEE